MALTANAALIIGGQTIDSGLGFLPELGRGDQSPFSTVYLQVFPVFLFDGMIALARRSQAADFISDEETSKMSHVFWTQGYKG